MGKKTSMKWNNITDFEQAIQHAEERGAKVREIGPLTELKGPAGTILLTGRGKQLIPHDTKKTLWRWFKLAGLIVLPFLCVAALLFGGP